ncbi:MAG: 6-carboxytetrahydropterin synthase QueD [Neisseriaceae bacterium]
MTGTYTVNKQFCFEMAHLLDGHDGKCKNLHGHGYVLQVEVTAPLCREGVKEGMVIDFGDLKTIVEEKIISHLDHAFIYDQRSTRESKIAEVLISLNSKVYAVNFRSTAEQLAQHIFELLKQTGLPVSCIRLWESSDSSCEYRL